MGFVVLSRILFADFAPTHSLLWNLVICVFVLTPAYFFWTKGTSGAPGHPSNKVTGAESTNSSLRDEQPRISETRRAKFPSDVNENSLEVTLSQAKRKKPCRDVRTLAADGPRITLARTDYTVGWICAIGTEYVAAQAILDEKHEGPENVSDGDDNDYTLGRIGRHNVVIAVLPMRKYGIASAASVAKGMSRSFSNVRVGLMVGVGGGAPSKDHDIRLGDIVVSAPGNGNGGVFQYDFGKTVQGEAFHITGFLNQPPHCLQTAVNGLKAQYESNGQYIDATIDDILKEKPRLRQKYKRPSPSTDRLYPPEFSHPSNHGGSCESICGDDALRLVPRREMHIHEDDPIIHYGLIASANQVLKML
ncbi:hypothetical protein E5D57_008125 [Metarhizium anisopliae]|nr:hypothetical protein E5D57_008125 [Metarhizium anisopliae]